MSHLLTFLLYVDIGECAQQQICCNNFTVKNIFLQQQNIIWIFIFKYKMRRRLYLQTIVSPPTVIPIVIGQQQRSRKKNMEGANLIVDIK